MCLFLLLLQLHGNPHLNCFVLDTPRRIWFHLQTFKPFHILLQFCQQGGYLHIILATILPAHSTIFGWFGDSIDCNFESSWLWQNIEFDCEVRYAKYRFVRTLVRLVYFSRLDQGSIPTGGMSLPKLPCKSLLSYLGIWEESNAQACNTQQRGEEIMKGDDCSTPS